jgi:LysR family transcriptional regulator, glycine cleavage system transcriptional activator
MPKYRLPLLNSLRAFEAAARHQSIKHAGAELHVSSAAVTRHIQKLEAQLGRKLFLRRHKQVILTEAGEIYLKAVTAAFIPLQRGFVQLRSRSSLDRLVISVDPDFAVLWLVPRLGEFYTRVPNTLVEIVAERTELSLQNERTSCFIQYAEAGLKSEDFDFLFQSKLFPVCSPKLVKDKAIRSFSDLKGLVVLHDRTLDEWEDYAAAERQDEVLSLRSGGVFSETMLCLEAAVRGQGIAIGDDYLAADYLDAGRLVRLFEREVLSTKAYYFGNGRSADSAPAVGKFRDWLLESIQRAGKNID